MDLALRAAQHQEQLVVFDNDVEVEPPSTRLSSLAVCVQNSKIRRNTYVLSDGPRDKFQIGLEKKNKLRKDSND
jgi:hypothetical protein